MLGLVIGGGIGVLILIILIKLYRKTGKTDAFGFKLKCPKCGHDVIDTNCPNCAKKSNQFGV